MGKSNTKYFSAIIKERNSRKNIAEITSLTGSRLTDPKAIKSEIISFYKGLMQSTTHTLPAVNRRILNKGPKLNHQQKLDLCALISDQEIYAGLCSVGDDSALGINGYNAIFFKKTWHIVKEKVTDIVKELFTTGKMLKAVNCTTITLVPKVTNLATVK